MASRRVTKSAIDWAKSFERIRPEMMSYMRLHKSINDKHVASVLQLPETLPKIDFAYYKSHVEDPSIVEKVERLYGNINVPYPKDPDNLHEKVNEQEQTSMKIRQDMVAAKQETIAECQALIDEIDSIPSPEKMTMQMWSHYFPDRALNPVENPTFWPHSPATQPSHKDSRMMNHY